MNNNLENEFFIGWQGRAPPATGRWIARATTVAGMFVLVLAAGVAALQRTIGPAQWDYGHARTFTGVLVVDPVPALALDTPEPSSGASILTLVNPAKFGFDPAATRANDGKRVRLEGSLLHRGSEAMLEVVPGSVETLPDLEEPRASEALDLGEHVLTGEIVDSKCFLGAMNPGVLKPHRACAILCISSGIPPILVVRDGAGEATCYHLTGPAGEAVNSEVLDFVAEPVELRGRVLRLGERLVLRFAPATIRRLP